LALRLIQFRDFAPAFLGTNDTLYFVQRVAISCRAFFDLVWSPAGAGQASDLIDDGIISVSVKQPVDIGGVFGGFGDALARLLCGLLLDGPSVIHPALVEAGVITHRVIEVLQIGADAFAKILDHRPRVIGKLPGTGLDVEAGQGQAIQHQFGIEAGIQAVHFAAQSGAGCFGCVGGE
jgi:hypothetical protein